MCKAFRQREIRDRKRSFTFRDCFRICIVQTDRREIAPVSKMLSFFPELRGIHSLFGRENRIAVNIQVFWLLVQHQYHGEAADA